MPPRPGERSHGRHGDVVAEQSRRGTGPPAATIEDDVVEADRQGRVDIGLDVLCGELGAHRNAARTLLGPGDELGDLADAVELPEPCR